MLLWIGSIYVWVVIMQSWNARHKKSGLPHLPIRYLGPEKPSLELTEWYPHRMCSVPIKCAWGQGESSQHTPGYSYSIPVSIHYRPYPWEYWVSQVQAAWNKSFVTRFSKFIVRHPIVGTCHSLMASGLCKGNCFIRIDERKVRKKVGIILLSDFLYYLCIDILQM